MQYRVGRVVKKLAAIEERDDLDAGGKDMVVEFVDLLVDALKRGVGVVAFLQEDDAFNDVVVVDELPVLVVDGLLAAGFVRVARRTGHLR